MSKNGAEDTNEREALITEICDYILKAPGRLRGKEDDEEKVHTLVVPDLESSHGKASITYHLRTAVADFFKEFEGRLDSIRIKRTDGTAALFNTDTKTRRDTVLSILVQYATLYMIMGMAAEIEAAINKLYQKAIIYGEARAMSEAINNTEQDDGKIDLRESISSLKQVLAKETSADEKFVEKLRRIENVYLSAGKGRPRTWTKETLEGAVRKASAQIKREKYRTPTLGDVARVLNNRNPDRMRLTAKSLGEMLRRYEVDWKGIKAT